MKPADTLESLARALAEPMPRRRALRLLGASFASVSVPWLRPSRASAAPRRSSGRCGADQRTCQKGAEAGGAQYCCPSPSWQWFCGGQDNAYRCINQCRGPVNFPCTALIADRYAGRNGVCCDRRIHSGCDPARKNELTGQIMRTSGGGSVPECIPCAGTMCENKRVHVADPSRWVCCVPPSTCVKGVCRCKNGRYATNCYSGGTRVYGGSSFDVTLLGQTCCPPSARNCCGTTCCKSFGCCGTTCCPVSTSLCASSGGRKVCCSRERVTSAGDSAICCPAGTVANPSTGGCCPEGSLDCCTTAGGQRIDCGEKICVRGRCVAP